MKQKSIINSYEVCFLFQNGSKTTLKKKFLNGLKKLENKNLVKSNTSSFVQTLKEYPDAIQKINVSDSHFFEGDCLSLTLLYDFYEYIEKKKFTTVLFRFTVNINSEQQKENKLVKITDSTIRDLYALLTNICVKLNIPTKTTVYEVSLIQSYNSETHRHTMPFAAYDNFFYFSKNVAYKHSKETYKIRVAATHLINNPTTKLYVHKVLDLIATITNRNSCAVRETSVSTNFYLDDNSMQELLRLMKVTNYITLSECFAGYIFVKKRRVLFL